MRGERPEHRLPRVRGVRALVAGLVVLGATASVVRAQECSGAASFGATSLRIGVTGERRDDRARLTAAFALGGERAFGEISGGIATWDALQSTGALIGVAGGLEREFRGGLHACPRVSLLAGFGPRGIDGSDVDASTLDAMVGVEAGRAFGLGRGVQLVPFAAASLRWARLVLDAPPGGESFRRLDAYGSIDAGVGTVIAHRVSLVPRISTSIGALDEGTVYSLTVAVGVGGRR